MAQELLYLENAWVVDQAILSEDDRVVVVRFGDDSDWTCMQMDETLSKIAPKVKYFAVVYLVDISQVRDFNEMYELYDPFAVMFFFRNKHIMVDNNNKITWAITDEQELIDIIETVYRGARKGRLEVKSTGIERTPCRILTPPSTGAPMEMLRRPIPLWKHLKILTDNLYVEDALLLYEITNQSTSSTRWTVPENPEEFEVFHRLGVFNFKAKRYAQANAIFKTIIQTFPNRSEEDDVVETPREIEYKDFTYMCLYRTLQKTNKLREAYEALTHVRGQTFHYQKQNAIMLLDWQNNEEPLRLAVPEHCDDELPDENNHRKCDSSLGPVMSVLLKGKGDAMLVKRFSDQFLGTERSDVFLWLKSIEAVGKRNIDEAIACLKKIPHKNPRVLTAMAHLHWKAGEEDEARRLLRTAHANDPLWIDLMDLLACLSFQERFRNSAQYESLIEELANTLNTEWPHRVETYVVNGLHIHSTDLDMALEYTVRVLDCLPHDSDKLVYVSVLHSYCSRQKYLKDNGLDFMRERSLRNGTVQQDSSEADDEEVDEEADDEEVDEEADDEEVDEEADDEEVVEGEADDEEVVEGEADDEEVEEGDE